MMPPYPEAVFPELPDEKRLLLVSEADELLRDFFLEINNQERLLITWL